MTPEPTIVPVVVTKEKKKRKATTTLPDSNWKKLKQTMPVSTPKPKPVAIIPVPAPVELPRRLRTGNMYYEHTGIVALDCEMVGDAQKRSMLGRVCLIDDKGNVLLDEFVIPPRPVVDFRTQWSGILPHHLSPNRALKFTEVQAKILVLLEGKIVVGHGLKNDFEVLMIEHPKHLIRDTSYFRPFMTKDGKPRKLKILALELLKCPIQEGRKGHDPKIDAKAALDLYVAHSKEWESSLAHQKIIGGGKRS
ncbi:hypothetical protein BASA81_005878 [Batrachochytrium salamandrivorans]|nr:hypothetical protein BASA81_005878 [Batrachochytrium salamandrivorans]